MTAFLENPINGVLAGVAAVLFLATLIIHVLRLVRPGRDWHELTLRLKSWYVMALVTGAAILLDPRLALLLLALISYLALKEYFTLIPTRPADRLVLFVAYLSIPVQYYWISINWFGMFVIFVPVYLFLLIPAIMVLRGETKGFLSAAGSIHWGLMQTVFAIGHAAYLLVLTPSLTPPFIAPAPANITGAGLFLYLLIITEGNDVAQYVTGRLWGRHPVAPQVSPKKTREGLAGGIIATMLISLALGPYLTPMSWPMSLLAGFGLSMAGFLGDLAVSAVKRDLGVKDSGHLIPGHGGILDRVDSLIFTAPVFFHTIRYFYY